MKKALASLCLIFLLTIPLHSEPNRALIDSVLTVTGLTEQLAQTSEILPRIIESERGSVDNRVYELVSDILIETFSAESFTEQMYKHIEADYREDYLEEILSRYRTPLFEAIAESEVNYIREYDIQKIESFDLSSVPPERAKIFSDYIEDSEQLEKMSFVAEKSMEAFFTIFNLMLPEDRRIPEEVISMIMTQTDDPETRQSRKEEYIRDYALEYEPFNNKQIRIYFDFCLSPPGVWLNEILVKSMGDSFNTMMRTAAGRILTELNITGFGI